MERGQDSLKFETSAFREAARAGAKDPDYFNYLAGRAKQEQGVAFNLTQFTAQLKTERAELFGGTPTPAPTPANTTAGNPPAQNATKKAQLQQQLEDAKKARDIGKVLKLETELSLL
ncbi:hypothetical protein IT570_03340 [Candidatus Sumerlaeota bacterium]|nr:hypothetical protein [Candidatus Sumerlaeota bacterium]